MRSTLHMIENRHAASTNLIHPTQIRLNNNGEIQMNLSIEKLNNSQNLSMFIM